jgi:hypothetical protein
MRMENNLEVIMGRVEGKMGLMANGYRVSVWGDKKVLEIVVMGI